MKGCNGILGYMLDYYQGKNFGGGKIAFHLGTRYYAAMLEGAKHDMLPTIPIGISDREYDNY
jgi:hypothetical protein